MLKHDFITEDNPNLDYPPMFIQSFYLTNLNKELPCYLINKLGRANVTQNCLRIGNGHRSRLCREDTQESVLYIRKY